MPSSGRATFERYLKAVTARDFVTVRALAHPDFEDAYPQSGEVIVGIENLIALEIEEMVGARGLAPPITTSAWRSFAWLQWERMPADGRLMIEVIEPMTPWPRR